MTSMWRTSGWILVGSALILALSLGVRHGFGLFLACLLYTSPSPRD